MQLRKRAFSKPIINPLYPPLSGEFPSALPFSHKVSAHYMSSFTAAGHGRICPYRISQFDFISFK